MTATSEPTFTTLARIRGCLLGGAVGDALGAAVEFMSMEEIRTAYGPHGIQEYGQAYGRVGAITDDTQMTLFTAEGLLRAHARFNARGMCHVASVIHHALVRWLYTQGEQNRALLAAPDGWLLERQALFSRRAPGLTCLSSLRAASHFGEEARNDSKGCGAIMRIAPIGLFVDANEDDPERPPRAYEIACESAKSTHAHPCSTFSSGYFAVLIARLAKGASLRDAVTEANPVLAREPAAREVLSAVERAVELARSSAPSVPGTVEQLGQGWVAEEALALSLFCALRAESFDRLVDNGSLPAV
jgi:ADP-ribosylglycohydrolase